MNEIIILQNNNIIEQKQLKLTHKKFTPDYLSKLYTPYKDKKHTLQSITKSIVSLLYGIAIENKHIKLDNLDNKIYNFFNNYKLDKNIKIKHLLNMTSGINWQMNEDYDSTNNATYQMEHSEDWIEFIMNSKMKYKPGKHFQYKDCDTVLLGYIFYKLTKLKVDEYAEKYLFKKLKISAYWNKAYDNYPDPEGGLYMDSKSLLEIGKLILNDGKYKNKQIINKKYLDLMMTNQQPKNTKSFFKYSYQWWIYDNVIFGWGWRGQYLIIDKNNNKIGLLFQWNNKNEIQPYEFIKQIIKK